MYDYKKIQQLVEANQPITRKIAADELETIKWGMYYGDLTPEDIAKRLAALAHLITL